MPSLHVLALGGVLGDGLGRDVGRGDAVEHVAVAVLLQVLARGKRALGHERGRHGLDREEWVRAEARGDDDLAHAEVLVLRQARHGRDLHQVADAAFVVLVVRHKLAVTADVLLDLGVVLVVGNGNGDRLLHAVSRDAAAQGLGRGRLLQHLVQKGHRILAEHRHRERGLYSEQRRGAQRIRTRQERNREGELGRDE